MRPHEEGEEPRHQQDRRSGTRRAPGGGLEQDRQAGPTATATGTEVGPEADISAGEGETVYLYARQAFSPSLDRWTVDVQMEELTYTRYDCLGGVGAEGLATLEPRDQENVWEAT